LREILNRQDFFHDVALRDVVDLRGQADALHAVLPQLRVVGLSRQEYLLLAKALALRKRGDVEHERAIATKPGSVALSPALVGWVGLLFDAKLQEELSFLDEVEAVGLVALTVDESATRVSLLL